MNIVTLGIDLGKNSCSLVGLNEQEAVVLRRRMRRESIVALTAKLPACTVAMEPPGSFLSVRLAQPTTSEYS